MFNRKIHHSANYASINKRNDTIRVKNNLKVELVLIFIPFGSSKKRWGVGCIEGKIRLESIFKISHRIDEIILTKNVRCSDRNAQIRSNPHSV